MKFKVILSLFLLALTIEIFGQENRVSADEELKNVFNGTWDLRSINNNSIQINSSFDDQVLDAPVDGGLGILMTAGVLYGAGRIRRKASKA